LDLFLLVTFTENADRRGIWLMILDKVSINVSTSHAKTSDFTGSWPGKVPKTHARRDEVLERGIILGIQEWQVHFAAYLV